MSDIPHLKLLAKRIKYLNRQIAEEVKAIGKAQRMVAIHCEVMIAAVDEISEILKESSDGNQNGNRDS